MAGESAMQLAIAGGFRGYVERALAAGLRVAALEVAPQLEARLAASGGMLAQSWEQAVADLALPRVVLCDLPPGDGIERALDEGSRRLAPGDVMVDASGSWWCDTLRRWRRLRHRAVYLVDVTEAVPLAGPPRLLLAGEEQGVRVARAALLPLAPEGGLDVAGGPGAAHFLEALADGLRTLQELAVDEARQLAEAWPGRLRPGLVEELWPLAAGEQAAGRAVWLLDDAVRLEAAVPLLGQAVMLKLGERLEAHRSRPPLPRLGPFTVPEEE